MIRWRVYSPVGVGMGDHRIQRAWCPRWVSPHRNPLGRIHWKKRGTAL
jgi:hypothetical protein